MTLMKAVADRLKRLQIELGYTDYRIQKEGGVPRSTVGKITSTKFKTVELDTLYQITQTMKISLKDFFDDPIFDNVTD